MKLLRQIWQDFRRGENIDLYLTVFVSIIVTVLNITGIAPSSLLAPLNLAVLALLSIAILGNRYRIEEVLERVNTRGERLLVKFPDNQILDMEKANVLTLIGVDLRQTLHLHYSLFLEKLTKGHTIRLVLIDPDSPACGIAALRYYAPMSPDDQRAVIQASLRMCQELKTKTNGTLEVRLVEDPLTFGATVVDPKTSHGALYYWHYSYKMSDANRPKMVLRPVDGYWYEFFNEEVTSIWNNAKPWPAEL